MPDFVTLITQLSSLPLHAILLAAVVVLWRRIKVLEDKLEACLSSSK